MSTETIVLTGATGFCGFAILQEALQFDYNIRLVVRSAAKAEILRNNPCFKSLTRGTPRCSFYVVPDLGVSGAPAINNTLSALESARKSKSVKRVVITSSCAIFIPLELLGGPVEKPVTVTEENINADIPPPFANILVAYVASKTSSFLRAREWMQEHKPNFDIVNVCPTYVQGRNELATSPQDLLTTSNVLFLRMALGLAPKGSPAEIASVVHVEDVAAIHVAALNKDKIPAGEYLFGQEVQWNDVNRITKELFPEQVAQGLLPCTGDVPTKSVICSKAKTEKTFGIELKSVEDMVEDLMEQFLELSGVKRQEDDDE
jgi:nucleoside-diphosphate-sugar epimerase